MKRTSNIIMGMAVAAVLASCSTTDNEGLTVGNVSNTKCESRTRAYINSTKLKLTREGDHINGELTDYQVNCSHSDIKVTCNQEGNALTIKVDENLIAANCICPINIYFTIYETEGDEFDVKLNNQGLGMVSFVGHNVTEIDLRTKEQAHEEGFSYTPTLDYSSISPTYPTYPGERPFMWINYDPQASKINIFNDLFKIDYDYTYFDLKIEAEEDGTLVFMYDTDGQKGNEEQIYMSLSASVENVYKDSYHIKLNPHKKLVTDEDGTQHEEMVCDFDGYLTLENRQYEAYGDPIDEEEYDRAHEVYNKKKGK